ncbi:Uncharacterised protein [Mycobacteroides abscessus]|nr:Uncharacterised protein [Mycobacteroides abscessus]
MPIHGGILLNQSIWRVRFESGGTVETEISSAYGGSCDPGGTGRRSPVSRRSEGRAVERSWQHRHS